LNRNIDAGATVLLSTHVMANAEEMCQHWVMIHQGRKVLDELMIGLRRQFDPQTIHFEPLDPDADPLPLRAVPGVERINRHESHFTITMAAGVDPAGAIGRLKMTLSPARVELARRRLEDVFMRIAAEGAAGSDAARALRADLVTPGTEGAFV
jgi:ABC-2 type transport system ATP-binding protein